jgi:sec-independent protein translocase protein TatA
MLVVILIIALLVIGPGKIGKLGGELGIAIREFRKGLNGDEGIIDANKDAKKEIPPPSAT